MSWLKTSLALLEANDALLSVSTVWSELGVCYLGIGDDQKAMELFRKSEHVDYSVGWMHSYQVDLANIGNVYLHRRDYFTALSYYQRAVSLAREIKDPVSVKRWTYNINLAYARIIAAVDTGKPIIVPESTPS
jgi:tetratricopeptide (TPR) repeat protein